MEGTCILVHFVHGQAVKEEELVHEVAKIPQLYNYSALGLAYVPEGASDIIVSGMIKELKNRAFDFYAFNKLNYERWQAGVSYQAYVEAKKVTAYSLSISPTREDVNDGLRLVVSNAYLQEPMESSLIDETVRIGLFENWNFRFFFPPLMLGYSAELTVKGTASGEGTGERNTADRAVRRREARYLHSSEGLAEDVQGRREG